MTTLDTLRAARALIADPSRWNGDGGYARDRRGRIVAPCSPNAVRWCALGAIDHEAARRFGNYQAATTPLYRVADDCISFINDNQGHAAVLALFDRAIAAEEAKAVPVDVPLYVPSAWLPVEVPA